LTPREREVALLVERNLSNDEIARELGIKRGTVKIHVHKILKKGGLSRRLRRPSKGTKFPRRMSGAGIERIREAQQEQIGLLSKELAELRYEIAKRDREAAFARAPSPSGMVH
jgi:transposase